jgi:hypothetical protein
MLGAEIFPRADALGPESHPHTAAEKETVMMPAGHSSLAPSDLALEPPGEPPGLARRLTATLGSLAAAAALPVAFTDMHAPGPGQVAILLIPTVLCTLSAVLLHHGYLGSQVLARATWWSNLIFGTLVAISAGDAVGNRLGFMLAIGSGLALLAMGRAGLDAGARSGRFHPVAYRGLLIVALVMALADAQSLLFFGAIMAHDHTGMGMPPAILPLVCAGVMMIAVFGLFRLAVWGLMLNLLANVAIAGLGLAGALELPGPIVGSLVATAVLQILLPVPMLVAMARGTARTQRAGRNYWPALAAIVTAMMLLSAYATLLHPGRLVSF